MMAWLAAFFSSVWSKLIFVAGLVAAVIYFGARVQKTIGDAALGEANKDAHDHQVKTGEQVSDSDNAIRDPNSSRRDRVRDRFERDD